MSNLPHSLEKKGKTHRWDHTVNIFINYEGTQWQRVRNREEGRAGGGFPVGMCWTPVWTTEVGSVGNAAGCGGQPRISWHTQERGDQKKIPLWMGWGLFGWDPIQQIHCRLRILKLGELVTAAEVVTGNNCGDKPLENPLEAEGKEVNVDLTQITWANPGNSVETCWKTWGPES